MKLVVFDLENTLIYNEFLPEIAHLVGKEKEVAAITRQGIDGKIDWTEGFLRRASMLKGLHRETIAKVAEQLRLVPGALGFVRGLKARGHKVVLITGGPREVTKRAQEVFGADEVFSNEFVYENDIFTGEVIVSVTPKSKGTIVSQLGEKLGIPKEDIVAFADGLMDSALLQSAGVRLGINSGGKLKHLVDFDAKDFHEAYEWLANKGIL